MNNPYKTKMYQVMISFMWIKRHLMKRTTYLIFGLVFSSCADLDEVPYSALAPENYWNNESEVNSFVLGIYTPLKTPVQFEQQFFKLTVLPHPFLTSRVAADDQTFSTLQYTATNGAFGTIWRTMYRGINYANVALANIPHVGLPEEKVNKFLAEARFMRAFYYFHLVRLFGGVPLHLESTTSLDLEKLKLPRATVQEVYDAIIADLQFAEIHLQDRDQVGRPSKGTAKAYLGEVYLTMAGKPLEQSDKFALASAKLKEVVDNEGIYGYGLMPNYGDVFSVNHEGNEEMVFVSPSIQVSGAGSYLPFGACPPNHPGASNSAQYRWGVLRPFFNRYAAEDTRRDATLVVDYVDKSGRNVIAQPGNTPPYRAQNGIGIVKYTDPNPPTINSAHGTDVPFMRYSEVLLMLAEALNEIGDTELALPYLNRVRQRANLDPVTADSQSDLRNKIRTERDFELMAEFKAVYDIRRWGTLPEVISTSRDCINAGTVYDSKLELYPIPLDELDRNPNLEQNQGYPQR